MAQLAAVHVVGRGVPPGDISITTLNGPRWAFFALICS
jgi:hypothetical protein